MATTASRRSGLGAAAPSTSSTRGKPKDAEIAHFKAPALPQRGSHASGAAASKASGAKAPATRGRGPAAAAAKSRRSKRPTIKIDAHNLWDIVTDRSLSAQAVVAEWLSEYHINPPGALLAVVNMMLQATGCPESLNEAQFEDQDALADYLEELQQHFDEDFVEYPLIVRSAAARKEIAAYFTFMNLLIQTDDDALWDGVLLEVLCNWVVAMSSSNFRPFRHTATSTALQLCTSLAPVVGDADHANIDSAREIHATLYNGVFVHRYRDVDPLIRRECMLALGEWLDRAPAEFLDPTYVRYFGWLLNDREPSVRLTVLNALLRTYSNAGLMQGMRLFSERFKARLIEMAIKEVDVNVRSAAAEVTAKIYQLGVLDPEDVNRLLSVTLFYHNDAVHEVLTEEVETMDWAQFGSWLAREIEVAYGIDQSAPLSSEHAIAHLVEHYPIPLFDAHASLISLLRRKESTSKHESILLQVLAALSSKREAVTLQLMVHLKSFLVKNKGDDSAVKNLVMMVRACDRKWIDTSALSNALGSVLDELYDAYFRAQDPGLVHAIADLLLYQKETDELEVIVQPKIDAFLADCDPDKYPIQTLAALRRFPMPNLDVSILTNGQDHLEMRYIMCLRAKEPDLEFAPSCLAVLREDPQQFHVASMLCEFATVFNVSLPEEAGEVIENVLTTLLQGFISKDTMEDAALSQSLTQVQAQSEKHFERIDSAVRLIAVYVKLLESKRLGSEFAPTLLQFYRAIELAEGETEDELKLQLILTVDEGSRHLADQLLPHLAEQALAEVALVSMQRALRIREGQGHGLNGLAHMFATVYRKLKVAKIQPVLLGAMQWVMDVHESAVPETDVNESILDRDAQEAAARENVLPFARALAVLVGCATMTECKALYTRFQASKALDPVLTALARKAGINPTHTGPTAKKTRRTRITKAPRVSKVTDEVEEPMDMDDSELYTGPQKKSRRSKRAQAEKADEADKHEAEHEEEKIQEEEPEDAIVDEEQQHEAQNGSQAQVGGTLTRAAAGEARSRGRKRTLPIANVVVDAPVEKGDEGSPRQLSRKAKRGMAAAEKEASSSSPPPPRRSARGKATSSDIEKGSEEEDRAPSPKSKRRRRF